MKKLKNDKELALVKSTELVGKNVRDLVESVRDLAKNSLKSKNLATVVTQMNDTGTDGSQIECQKSLRRQFLKTGDDVMPTVDEVKHCNDYGYMPLSYLQRTHQTNQNTVLKEEIPKTDKIRHLIKSSHDIVVEGSSTSRKKSGKTGVVTASRPIKTIKIELNQKLK